MRLVIALMLVLGVALAALGLPVAAALVQHAAAYRTAALTTMAIGAAGGALFAVAGRAVAGMKFFDILCHEGSHAVWAFLVGGQVRAMSADATSGGHTQFAVPTLLSPVRSFFVAIAPYWFSPMVVVAVLALVGLEPLRGDAPIIVGALFGYSLIQPLLQWHVQQPDLRAFGVLPPMIVAGCLWAGVLVLTVSAMTGGVARGVHAVYVGSARALGVSNAEWRVKRVEAGVAALTHPRWLSLVRAAADQLSESESAQSQEGRKAARKPQSR